MANVTFDWRLLLKNRQKYLSSCCVCHKTFNAKQLKPSLSCLHTFCLKCSKVKRIYYGFLNFIFDSCIFIPPINQKMADLPSPGKVTFVIRFTMYQMKDKTVCQTTFILFTLLSSTRKSQHLSTVVERDSTITTLNSVNADHLNLITQ